MNMSVYKGNVRMKDWIDARIVARVGIRGMLVNEHLYDGCP
jgi:hypothetical protein